MANRRVEPRDHSVDSSHDLIFCSECGFGDCRSESQFWCEPFCNDGQPARIRAAGVRSVIRLDPEHLVTEMSQAFPQFPRATIERLVIRTLLEYEGSRIRDFVPILARREVVACLRYVEALEPARA